MENCDILLKEYNCCVCSQKRNTCLGDTLETSLFVLVIVLIFIFVVSKYIVWDTCKSWRTSKSSICKSNQIGQKKVKVVFANQINWLFPEDTREFRNKFFTILTFQLYLFILCKAFLIKS